MLIPNQRSGWTPSPPHTHDGERDAELDGDGTRGAAELTSMC
jgi:hypothetical protein